MRLLRRLGVVVVVLVAVTLAASATIRYLHATEQPELAARLSEALAVGAGAAVAEIGAGDGVMAIQMARIVGPQGKVIATELTERQLESIRRNAAGAALTNVVVVLAGQTDTNLPAGCCDAVYMQRVYHHLASPAPVIASIARALKPGGRLAVMEFEPGWIANFTTPPGVPDRGGHGVPKPMLVREMQEHGFRSVGEITDFGSELYLAVFQR